MKNTIIVLVLMVAMVGAGVVPESLHMSDAQRVDDLMAEEGINGKVKIFYFEDSTVYGVEFRGDHFTWDSDNDVMEVSAFFTAVALVSQTTSWHSGLALIFYDNITLGMYTEDCRTVTQMIKDGCDISEFLDNHMMADYDVPLIVE